MTTVRPPRPPAEGAATFGALKLCYFEHAKLHKKTWRRDEQAISGSLSRGGVDLW